MRKRLASAFFGIAFLADLVVILAFAEVFAPRLLTDLGSFEQDVHPDLSRIRICRKDDMPTITVVRENGDEVGER